MKLKINRCITLKFEKSRTNIYINGSKSNRVIGILRRLGILT